MTYLIENEQAALIVPARLARLACTRTFAR